MSQIRGSTQVRDRSVTLDKLDTSIFENNNVYVDKEDLSSLCDGTRTSFALANECVVGSEHVFLRGLLRKNGADYTIGADNKTITFANAPYLGDELFVSYRKKLA
jgi:hypothetical protein